MALCIHISASTDANKRGLKIFLYKIPGSSKTQKFNLPHADNYLHNTYILVSSGGLEPIPNTYQETTILLYTLQNKAVKEKQKKFLIKT